MDVKYMKEKIKKILSGLLTIVMVLGLFSYFYIFENNTIVYAEDKSVTPFTVTATDLDSNGFFTVNINISKDCVIQAYKIIVSYNGDNLIVKDGKYGFGNYSSFDKKYNANGKGICAKNHLSNDNHVVFAGAQPQLDCAKLNAGDRVAYITFKYTGSEASYKEIISSVATSIVNCSDGEKDIVKDNPDNSIDLFLPLAGDDLRGEGILPGDVDDNGKVDLRDAKVVLTVSLGISKLDAEKMEAADVDLDEKVTLKDAKLVLKYSLGIIKTFE